MILGQKWAKMSHFSWFWAGGGVLPPKSPLYMRSDPPFPPIYANLGGFLAYFDAVEAPTSPLYMGKWGVFGRFWGVLGAIKPPHSPYICRISQNLPKNPPSPSMNAKWTQNLPKIPQNGSKITQMCPKSPQNGENGSKITENGCILPKNGPNVSKMGENSPKWGDFEWFWVYFAHFGMILGIFCPFWVYFAHFGHFLTYFALFWHDLGPFWLKSG